MVNSEWPSSKFLIGNQHVYQQGCNWGGVPLLFLIAFHFPSSEEGLISIYHWVNRKSFLKNSCFEPETLTSWPVSGVCRNWPTFCWHLWAHIESNFMGGFRSFKVAIRNWWKFVKDNPVIEPRTPVRYPSHHFPPPVVRQPKKGSIWQSRETMV